ncbi:MAG: hypothetical protein P8X96_04750 [Desulfobacteraceae bacterium]
MVLKRKGPQAMHFIIVAGIAGLLLLVGCGPAQVKSKAMVPVHLTLAERHPVAVALHVDGGRSEHAMNLPVISNEKFLEALQAAIRQSTLFQDIAVDPAGDYRIDATIFNLSQPFFVRNPVQLEVAWQLTRMPDREIIWKKSIITSDTGLPSSEQSNAAGYNKTRAIEKAAQKNIKMALEQMSKINL